MNGHPVRLARPPVAALSPVAQIGRAMFFDVRLSASGAMSCATCHDPSFAYGPPNDRSVQLGGTDGAREGMRAVPSLRYLDRVPSFVIGPDQGDADAVPSVLGSWTRPVTKGPVTPKRAGATTLPLVPWGGLFWDGRADSFQLQASGPLLNPAEMGNADARSLASTFRALDYANRLARALGHLETESVPEGRLVDEALFAIARFEFEDPSFHPYASKYDAWLEGKTALTASELRGLRVFEDPAKGNCAACHLDRPTADGRPPLFTDWQYEALGVPRNERLALNHDRVDLGLCGPVRTDLRNQPEWCGMFRTPSLRNVTRRHAFFHNGVVHTLSDVMRFYNFRDVQPERVYPSGPDGQLRRFDDLPSGAARNLDVIDPPFNRRRGEPPPMTDQDIEDVIMFLGTLTDAD
ncbi:MAG TPA: cytochrome c peroxidase [Vicinamibacterales bacterium]|nr:cytochrome c peroxidase [Vicinamibacterales bacterium]